jgi:hypothetical protein
VAALNCYRALSGRETLEQISPGARSPEDFPKGFPIYVIYYPTDAPVLKREGLKVVYHDPFTDAAVAIRPEVESARLCSPAN